MREKDQHHSNKSDAYPQAILKPLFWEYDWASVQENLTSPFVIARILELGNPEQFHIFAELVGHKSIKTFLEKKGEKLLSPQSLNFWRLYYKRNEITETKISFFRYPYKLLHPVNQLDIISVAHLEDILCMKINAIINRGSRKDFTDVYFIINELSLSPEKCIELFQSKYGAYNPLVIHKAMSYFVDADNEPELKMLKSVRWEDIKKFMLKTFTNI